MAKQLKLMAEYECWPLWLSEPTGSENIDPSSLPLDADLVKRLRDWATTFDGTLNQDDPLSSGFSNSEALHTFEIEGELLWEQLRSKLHPDYEIRYKKTYSGEELPDPEIGSL